MRHRRLRAPRPKLKSVSSPCPTQRRGALRPLPKVPLRPAPSSSSAQRRCEWTTLVSARFSMRVQAWRTRLAGRSTRTSVGSSRPRTCCSRCSMRVIPSAAAASRSRTLC
eukprot:Amastigsp_a176225_16.p3 type:complete len:110 gc:universal Amastigsp_a176225_16:321-650(+)